MKRQRFSTRQTNKAKAARAAALKARALVESFYPEDVREMTLAEGIERRLGEVEKLADYRTVESRSRKLVAGRGFGERYSLSPDMWLHEITSATVKNLREARLREGMSEASIQREISLLRTIYNRARKAWNVRVAPNVRFEKDRNSNTPRCLSISEERALLRELEPTRGAGTSTPWQNRSLRGRRNMIDQYDLVIAMLDTGASYAEIAGLKWEAVDTRHWRTLTPAAGQPSKPLSPRLAAILRQRQHALIGCNFVFPAYEPDGRPINRSRGNARAGINSAMERAGINSAEKVAILGRADIQSIRQNYLTRRTEPAAQV
ncbi:MAG: hypothetical protein QGF53_11515 [Alphaproteobacteria bacterium]|nr:hypothetical protein [Alphaproteobacteria bacterium]